MTTIAQGIAPPHSVQAEQSVIGAVLLSPDAVLGAYLGDCHLSRDDFYVPRHATIWQAIMDLHVVGHAIDVLTVTEQLKSTGKLDVVGGEPEVDALTAAVPALGNLRRYGELVREQALRRRLLNATYEIQSGIQNHEITTPELAGWAEEKLIALDPVQTGGGYQSPEEISFRLLEAVTAGTSKRWAWPLKTLNRISNGGGRPGQMTFIGGPTSHGKSVFVDQCLHSMGTDGANVALFLNEMTREERSERTAARVAKVRLDDIQNASAGVRPLTQLQLHAITAAMDRQPIAMVEAPGWSMADIIREARRRRLDALAVDIVQGLPTHSGMKRHESLQHDVQLLDAFAKDTGCHVFTVGQVNRSRTNHDGTVPIPGERDIRDCAELGNRADNIIFIWRDQDEDTLDPIDTGLVRVAKMRGAPLKSVKVDFDGPFQAFLEQRDQPWDEVLNA